MTNYNSRIYDDYDNNNTYLIPSDIKVRDVSKNESSRKTILTAVIGGLLTVTSIISIIGYAKINKQLTIEKEVITSLQTQNEDLQKTITEELNAIDKKLTDDADYRNILENLVNFLETSKN